MSSENLRARPDFRATRIGILLKDPRSGRSGHVWLGYVRRAGREEGREGAGREDDVGPGLRTCDRSAKTGGRIS